MSVIMILIFLATTTIAKACGMPLLWSIGIGFVPVACYLVYTIIVMFRSYGGKK